MKKADWEKYRQILDNLAAQWDEEAANLSARELDKKLTEIITRDAHCTIPYGNGGKGREPFWNQ